MTVAVLLVDHPALDLQRRRDLARLQGELVRQQLPGDDLLEAGEIGVDRRHLFADQLADLGVGDQLLVVRRGDPLLLRPGLERLEVRHQQRREELPAVADHHRLADEAAPLQRVLDRRRRHVLAVGVDDQLLLAVGDPQEALGVDLADVAGVEPPLGVDHLRRLLLHVPVALHDVGALGEDLAVLGDPHLHPGDRLADRRPS